MHKESKLNAKITPKPVVESDGDDIQNNRITACVNPLVFIDADDRFHFGNNKPQITPESVLKYLSSETFIPTMDNIKKCYDWIAQDATKLFLVPAEAKILEKIVRPLKNAIGSYIIGNSFETIALCGTISEMIAIFLFEINEISIDGKHISNEGEIKRNLEKFEKFSQAKRIEKLHEFNLINNDVKSKFDFVRIKRNGYLHRLSKSHSNAASDAKDVFTATLDIFLQVSGLSLKDGKAIVNQKIINYLDKKNLVEKVPK